LLSPKVCRNILMATTAKQQFQVPIFLNGKTKKHFSTLEEEVNGNGYTNGYHQPNGIVTEQPQNASSKFKLKKTFVKQFGSLKPQFGFNGLGEIVYMRTYARIKPNGNKECWHETVERVVNGCFTMQKEWMEEQQLEWNEEKATKQAEEMYRRIYEMKFLPPGRGLWAMGTALTEERKLYAALNNCAFVSTGGFVSDSRGVPLESCDPSGPFCFLMDASMLGVGVGFDTKGAGKFVVQGPSELSEELFTIPDSREGWVDSIKHILEAYFFGRPLRKFDYSEVRPAGMIIRGFGGKTMGPGPLRLLHEGLREALENNVQRELTVMTIVDLMNLIGKCVVAGNVRRTAEIAFGDPESEEYIDLKDFDKNPQRIDHGWTSNNSVFAELGMDYSEICKRVINNGEPGFAWLENMQKYGRMNGVPDNKDLKAMGGNPCLEQTLESYEMCCLVETFPFKHDSLEDFIQTLKYAYLYGKTVTLGRTHWPRTNSVMLRNRRIGCSMSGLAQFVCARGLNELRVWCDAGYTAVQKFDEDYANLFGVPRSIKTTSIKPSGTVSLLAGATPGMHYPESRFYIRRIRISAQSDMLPALSNAGYRIEPCVSDGTAVVVEIPVDAGEGIRVAKDISMWEQLGFAAFLQRHWADNQVSCTVTFDKEKEGSQLVQALDMFQFQLKGVSFLPRLEQGAFPQMPYEAISEEEYLKRKSTISEEYNLQQVLRTSSKNEIEEMPDKFCDMAGCSIEEDPNDR